MNLTGELDGLLAGYQVFPAVEAANCAARLGLRQAAVSHPVILLPGEELPCLLHCYDLEDLLCELR